MILSELFSREYVFAADKTSNLMIFDPLNFSRLYQFNFNMGEATYLHAIPNGTIFVGTTRSKFAHITLQKSLKPEPLSKDLPSFSSKHSDLSKYEMKVSSMYDLCMAHDSAQNSIYMADMNKHCLFRLRFARKQTEFWKGHTNLIYGMAVSQGKSNRIVTVSYDSRIIVRDLRTKKILKTRHETCNQYIAVVHFNEAETRIMTGGYHGVVYYLSLKSLKPLWEFKFGNMIYALDRVGKKYFVGGGSKDYLEIVVKKEIEEIEDIEKEAEKVSENK